MKKGLFVGLCGLDIVYYNNTPLPLEDTKLKIEDVRAAIGGPAANAAITYSLLGGESTIITYIGNSAVSQVVKGMMAQFNIRIIDLCNDDDAKCISAIYVNTVSATRTILSGRRNIEKLSPLSVFDVEIANNDFVLYDGHFQQVEDKLLDCTKRLNKSLVIDIGSWIDTFDTILKYNPILICSEVFNKNGADGIELMDKFNYDNVAITRGSKPIFYKTTKMPKKAEIPTLKVKAIDTLGAGDIFHGAFCYFMFTKGCDFKTSLKNAAEVAGISTTVYGVVNGVKEYLKTVR